MTHDKFIHHECRSARNANPAGGGGHFDVIEDEYGFYVSNADAGFLTRVESLSAAITEAERLADKYDAENPDKVWSCASS